MSLATFIKSIICTYYYFFIKVSGVEIDVINPRRISFVLSWKHSHKYKQKKNIKTELPVAYFLQYI